MQEKELQEKELCNVLITEGVNARGFGFIGKVVMQDRRLDIKSKAIYSYFCSYAGAGCTAFPSVEKIRYDLKIGKDAYYKYMNQLIELGYIVVTNQRKDGTKFTNNIYFLPQNPVPKETVSEKQGYGKKPCPENKDTEFPDTYNEDIGFPDSKINSIKSNITKIINNNNISDSDMKILQLLYQQRENKQQVIDPSFYFDWMNE